MLMLDFLNVFIIIVLINLYNQKINTKQFNSQRDVIEYVNSNKENVYFYSTISLGNRYLAYSVYEKIPDNTFSNLAPIAEWTTYTENYYELKERYNLDNIIEDLYKKDNVYTIMIKKYSEQHLNILKDYINNHYNDIIEWDLVKDFQSIQIYKLRKAD